MHEGESSSQNPRIGRSIREVHLLWSDTGLALDTSCVPGCVTLGKLLTSLSLQNGTNNLYIIEQVSGLNQTIDEKSLTQFLFSVRIQETEFLLEHFLLGALS
jgi:hypothetical protein